MHTSLSMHSVILASITMFQRAIFQNSKRVAQTVLLSIYSYKLFRNYLTEAGLIGSN